MREQLALVLNGGGARASYQAGVVRAIYEIIKKDQNLFDIITGNSAGAMNATFLSSSARDWGSATQYLSDFWQRVNPEDVFDMDYFMKFGSNLLKDTIFRSANKKNLNYILSTAPLKKLLTREIDFPEIRLLIKSKMISSVALSATNYYSGASVIFFDGDKEIPLWAKPSRFTIREELCVDHVMASSAIPLFFPPIKIKDSYYGDGCIRQTTPLSPAIHLGATKLIAIGIRAPIAMSQVVEMSLAPNPMPPISQIGGIMMNAIFLDSLEADLEMLERMNNMVKTIGTKSARRVIPILSLIPSRDLGAMTARLNEKMPALLRFFLKSIGITGQSGLDLLSYLAFDSSYTHQVVELGYEDTMKRKTEVINFFDSKN